MDYAQMIEANRLQRGAVLANAVKMKQQIFSGAYTPGSQNIINIEPRNVGLIAGFIIVAEGTLTNGATDTATRTGFGSANMLTNISFTDFNNYIRVNTTGYHLALLNSARQGFGYGGAYANNLPMGYGNNWSVFTGASTIAATADQAVRHTYYLPLAYSSVDTRGALFAGVVSAQANLSVTINADPFVGATDPLNAMYSGNNNGGWKSGTQVTITVYQVYWDQLPRTANGGPILPALDLNTIYDLKYTTRTGMSVGQDFPIPYSTFRDYLSTMAVFDNGGVFGTGSDVNYWSLTAANTTNLFKLDPEIAALEARQTFMADPPAGVYYFDHRDRPINTQQFGNMELNLNAASLGSSPQVIACYEMFSQVTQIAGASSLAV